MGFCSKSPNCPHTPALLWFTLWSSLRGWKLDSFWMKLSCSMCSISALNVIQLSVVFISSEPSYIYFKLTPSQTHMVWIWHNFSPFTGALLTTIPGTEQPWLAKVIATTLPLFLLLSETAAQAQKVDLNWGSVSEGCSSQGEAWVSHYEVAHTSTITRESLKSEGTKMKRSVSINRWQMCERLNLMTFLCLNFAGWVS